MRQKTALIFSVCRSDDRHWFALRHHFSSSSVCHVGMVQTVSEGEKEVLPQTDPAAEPKRPEGDSGELCQREAVQRDEEENRRWSMGGVLGCGPNADQRVCWNRSS